MDISLTYPNLTLQSVVDTYTGLLKLDKGGIWKCERNLKDGLCNINRKTKQPIKSTDPNYNGVGAMAQLINKAYGDLWYAVSGTSTNLDLLVELAFSFGGNPYFIAGIKANGSTGQLRRGWPKDEFSDGKFSSGGISHFVVVNGISTQWNNVDIDLGGLPSRWKWVRVYNPFDNRLEYYWWGDFRESWKADGSA